MVTPAAERDAVAHIQTAFGMSERRACRVLGCCRMTMRYQALRSDDVVLRDRRDKRGSKPFLQLRLPSRSHGCFC